MAGKKGRRGWGWLRQQGTRWQASYVGPDFARHCAPSTFTAKIDGEGWLANERRLMSSAPGRHRRSARPRPGPRCSRSGPTPRGGSTRGI